MTDDIRWVVCPTQAFALDSATPAAQPTYKVVKREKDRWWEVRDPQDELVCVTVYKRGTVEVVRRLAV